MRLCRCTAVGFKRRLDGYLLGIRTTCPAPHCIRCQTNSLPRSRCSRLINEFHATSISHSQLICPAEVKRATRPPTHAHCCAGSGVCALRVAWVQTPGSYRLACVCCRTYAQTGSCMHRRAVMRRVRLGSVHEVGASRAPWCHPQEEVHQTETTRSKCSRVAIHSSRTLPRPQTPNTRLEVNTECLTPPLNIRNTKHSARSEHRTLHFSTEYSIISNTQ